MMLSVAKYSEKTCLSTNLSTINSALSDQGWNPGRHGRKPESSHLSYDTDLYTYLPPTHK
jgi:hypothetical protein